MGFTNVMELGLFDIVLQNGLAAFGLALSNSFELRPCSITDKKPTPFQSDTIISVPNVLASRSREIRWHYSDVIMGILLLNEQSPCVCAVNTNVSALTLFVY